MPMLIVENLSKIFLPPISFSNLLKFKFRQENSVPALNDVSFRINKGTLVCVLGTNGAGKTTLLKIISSLILPDKGSVTLNGYKLGKDDTKIKSIVGFVPPPERSFYWRLSGRKNLEFFASLYGLSKQKAASKISELLKLFQVDYEFRRFDSYSNGMQQKFSLMRALLHDPELLLLDEPVKSLDYSSNLALRNFIKETLVKKQGKTVIFTTHQIAETENFADIFMIMHKGRISCFGTLDEIRLKTNSPKAPLGEMFIKLTQQ